MFLAKSYAKTFGSAGRPLFVPLNNIGKSKKNAKTHNNQTGRVICHSGIGHYMHDFMGEIAGFIALADFGNTCG
jgi:hypothetical protein